MIFSKDLVNLNEIEGRDMARPYDFPDPNDRSPNHPSELAERDRIISLYNSIHPNEPAQRMSNSVKTWFNTAATEAGWSDIQFVGDQAVLTASVTLNN
ncbi:hypothetical protein E0L35_10330 [Halomonas sp. ATBC28]|uniref:hypothetical protein n=1 Tax=Halomonas sp. ATBC28 TaxID=2545264 RepID=UPI00110E4268|nr:hypothetical protein [Halomonas sp. ATBC28]TMU24625.1 hypothetical protein E0L35_10330 [Halomonas sp. ATBC28]